MMIKGKLCAQLTKTNAMKISLIMIATCLLNSPLLGQVYSNKEVGKNNQQTIDSLKAHEYPYALPILGKKATQAGFNLPLPAGLNINYLWQESELIIENLRVGFNYGPMYDLSEVVRISGATSEAQALNFRPDIWILPFLNVYGIFARSQPSTTVDFDVYVPDSEGNWNNVISLNSKADFEATTMGFGLTPTIGVGGGWFALDMNFTWSDISALDEPAFATVFGPRIGKTFKLKKPNSNIAVWIGGFRLHLNSSTSGSLQLNDLVSTDGLQEKIDNGQVRVANSHIEVEAWWTGLTAAEQRNPANLARYEVATRSLDAAGRFLNGLDQTLNDEQYHTVQYALEKRPKDMWNFTVGSQYQCNKHWMVRLEFGFLGSRQQVIGGLQYRFGL
jgi:hypothetical protein